VSIWELREAQRKAAGHGISKDNEKMVFAILNEQRALEPDAAAKTKAARRGQQRRTEHAKQRAAKQETMPFVSRAPAPSLPPAAVRGYDPDKVRPLDDDR
jgi:putative transposase